MTDKKYNNSKKVPLKWRMIAWWKGYDIADIKERMRLALLKKNADNPLVEPVTERDDRVWDKDSVEATQIIWGDGFCGPGGRKNVVDMSKLLALSPKMSAMVLGAGLGGPARCLTQEFGVWVSGFEHNEILAEEGMKMSIHEGLEKKTPIFHRNLNKNPNYKRTFDRAYSKEAMFTIENKTGLLRSVYDALKDDSLFLISDYVLKNEKSLTYKGIINWIKSEPIDVFPITSELMVAALEKLGFKIRIQEDITDHYMDLVNKAWADTEEKVSQMIANGEAATKKMRAIQIEAQLWNRRTKAFRSGELRVYRYLAHKPAPPIK